MRINVSNEFLDIMLLRDVRQHNPLYCPNIYLGLSCKKETFNEETKAIIKKFVRIDSYLVSTNQKKDAINKLSFEVFPQAGSTCFEEDGSYNTGEIFTKDGITLEIITNKRSFPSLGMSYYEPTDRLIKYLDLHRSDNEWINPYTEEVILTKKGESRGSKPYDIHLSIRKSELKDYLAARKSGLLILRYSESMLETENELVGLPNTFYNFVKDNSCQSFHIDKSPVDSNKNIYFYRLWESFWLDQASRPRRWDALSEEKSQNGVRFTLDDGEVTTSLEGNEDYYFKILSFNPVLFVNILKKPNHKVNFHCLTNFAIVFPDGESLECCINKRGQIQSFFGQVAKLSIDKQRDLSAFSEPQKETPTPDFNRVYLDGEFPLTSPFNLTLSQCLSSVNEPWINNYGISLLLSPGEKEISDLINIGPVSNDIYELSDIMLEFQKAIIPEHDITKIKSQLDLSSQVDSINNYNNMKSIAYMQLLFAKESSSPQAESYILKAINELRNCKGHPKKVDEIIVKYGFSRKSTREIFYIILSEFCSLLIKFKDITENIFDTKIEPIDDTSKNPWIQLNDAKEYFKSC